MRLSKLALTELESCWNRHHLVIEQMLLVEKSHSNQGWAGMVRVSIEDHRKRGAKGKRSTECGGDPTCFSHTPSLPYSYLSNDWLCVSNFHQILFEKKILLFTSFEESWVRACLMSIPNLKSMAWQLHTHHF